MKRLIVLLLAAAGSGSANQNLGYDQLFGMMQPFYSEGGADEWDQKQDFDSRVESWRNERETDSEDD